MSMSFLWWYTKCANELYIYEISVDTPVDVELKKDIKNKQTWFQVQTIKHLSGTTISLWLVFLARGNTHIPMNLGDADVGCDLHAVRGGNQLSEVLLADPETSVFRVCCWLHSRQGSLEDNTNLAAV